MIISGGSLCGEGGVVPREVWIETCVRKHYGIKKEKSNTIFFSGFHSCKAILYYSSSIHTNGGPLIFFYTTITTLLMHLETVIPQILDVELS